MNSINIYYLGYFDTELNKEENRHYFLSSANKMKYIADSINRNGIKVKFISFSQTLSKSKMKRKQYEINSLQEVVLFNSFGRKNKILSYLNRIFIRLQVYHYLLTILGKDDIIMVYHSLSYCSMYKWLSKKTKKFIIEVEELYSDVKSNPLRKRLEKKSLFYANSYLFSTEVLNEKVNMSHKPYVVVYGIYNCFDGFISNQFNDNKIHIVYSGTFDPRKAGAYIAVSICQFLPDNYRMHILGFGSDSDINNIKSEIMKMNERSKCKVTYDGCLSGDEYIRFLRNCDIGLSTQKTNARFNDTSFPSKVLTYLSCGLIVVAGKIRVLTSSKINDIICLYDQDDACCIAKLIQEIKISNNESSRQMLVELDTQFVKDLRTLFIGSSR